MSRCPLDCDTTYVHEGIHSIDCPLHPSWYPDDEQLRLFPTFRTAPLVLRDHEGEAVMLWTCRSCGVLVLDGQRERHMITSHDEELRR